MMNIYFLGLISRTDLDLILYYSTISLIQHKQRTIIIASQSEKNNQIKQIDFVVLTYLINMLQKLIKYIFINKSINILLPTNVIDFKSK